MKQSTPVNMEAVRRFEKSADKPALETLIDEARWLATGSNSRFEDKADRMVSIAEEISRRVTPYTPCGKGCNHCCYMAVEVSSFEADMIGRYLGRDKQPVGQDISKATPAEIEAAQEASWARWTGKPCTLLGEDGKCTVYPVRPMACRTHHNLAKDETNCVIVMAPGQSREDLPTTPHLNLNEFNLYSATIMYQGGASYADLREWFPKKDEEK